MYRLPEALRFRHFIDANNRPQFEISVIADIFAQITTRKSMFSKHLFARICAGITLSLSIATNSDAQSSGHIRFDWGDEYQLPKRHEDLGFIGNAKDGYIQVGHDAHESLTFQKFDKGLHLKSERETSLEKLPKDYQSMSLTNLGDKYYWFFNTYIKADDRESIYAQEIDLASADMKGPAVELHNTTKLAGDMTAGGFFHFELKNKWNFYYSFDHSKVLIQYRKRPVEKDDSKSTDVMGFYVFDNNMKQLWGREARMPYTEERMDNGDYQVDSRGNVYMLAKVYDELRSRDRKHPNYHFEILRWSADKPEVAKIPFRFTDKFVNAANIVEDATGNIVAAGYYTNRRNSGSTDGVFILKLDEANNEFTPLKKGIYPFPASVMSQYESARTRRRMERKEEKGDGVEDANLRLHTIALKSDGTMQIYGEEQFSITTTTIYGSGYGTGFGMGRSSNSRTTYYYNDIMAMNIGADGELKWVRKIPKSQSRVDGGGSGGSMFGVSITPTKASAGGMSFKQFGYKGDSYLFFMDNMKNLDITKEETPKGHVDGRGGVLMAVKIDEAGNVTKSKVFDVREEKMTLTVADFDQVDFNQMIVRGRAKHRESQAALVTFE